MMDLSSGLLTSTSSESRRRATPRCCSAAWKAASSRTRLGALRYASASIVPGWMQFTMAMKAVPSRQLVPKSFTTTPVVLLKTKVQLKNSTLTSSQMEMKRRKIYFLVAFWAHWRSALRAPVLSRAGARGSAGAAEETGEEAPVADLFSDCCCCCSWEGLALWPALSRLLLLPASRLPSSRTLVFSSIYQ